MDWSPPGSSVHRILQATILEWVAMPLSRGSSRPRDQSLIAGSFFTVLATSTVLYKWINHFTKSRPRLRDWLNVLFPVFLIREDTPAPFLCRCASLAYVYLNSLSVFAPICHCAMSLIINFVPTFTVFASMKNAFFTGAKSQGKTGSSL